MKRIGIIGIILIFSGIVSAQDTVFEQDSWYLFKEHGPFYRTSINISSTNHFTKNMIAPYGLDGSGSVVYGIALTAKAFPSEVYGVYPPTMILYRQVAPGYPPSIAVVDSANIYDNMSKTCFFNYYVDDNVYNYAGNYVVPCYEFYFDTPHHFNNGDTFYISHYFPLSQSNALINWWANEQNHDPDKWYYVIDAHSNIDYENLYWWYSDAVDTIMLTGYSNIYPIHYGLWGGIFPIVKLRCTAMGNLQLVEQGYLSATVDWRQNETPEQYQVSIGPVGNKPDSGAMFYTADTFYTFTNLEPDTNYSVWVRKACRYTTAGYDTIVWSDWSNEVVFTAVGIDEVEADGVRITSQRGSIMVEGAEGREVRVYDMLGREVNGKGKSEKGKVTLSVPAAGIYMVRVGELSIRRVVVVR